MMIIIRFVASAGQRKDNGGTKKGQTPKKNLGDIPVVSS